MVHQPQPSHQNQHCQNLSLLLSLLQITLVPAIFPKSTSLSVPKYSGYQQDLATSHSLVLLQNSKAASFDSNLCWQSMPLPSSQFPQCHLSQQIHHLPVLSRFLQKNMERGWCQISCWKCWFNEVMVEVRDYLSGSTNAMSIVNWYVHHQPIFN